MKGYCDYPGHVGDFHTREKICRNWRQALPIKTQGVEIVEGEVLDEHAGCKKQIFILEKALAGVEDRYKQLNGIYQKLADQWNAFQATARPDNRNVHRAEAAGEVTRKLAEVFMALAYDTDAFDLIEKLLTELRDLQQGSGGRTVEVGGKLVPRRG